MLLRDSHGICILIQSESNPVADPSLIVPQTQQLPDSLPPCQRTNPHDNNNKMDVKYKAPKGGKSLLAKVAAKSGSTSSRGRGGGSTKGGGGSSSSSAMHGAGGGREGRSAKIRFSNQG